MNELGFHMMFRLEDDRVIAPSVRCRRLLARSVYRVCARSRLICFGAADTHLHLEVAEPQERLGRLTQRLTESLRRSLGLKVRFARPRIKPIKDQHHLVNTFHYVLNQRNRHGVRSDPFLDASSLLELLGLRYLATGSIALVRELLPRLTREDLLPHLWPVPKPGDPAPPADLLPSEQLVDACDAAAGAFGIATLTRKTEETQQALAALAQASRNQLSSPRIAAMIGRSRKAVWRLWSKEVSPRHAHALRLQLALRAWLCQAHPELLLQGPLLGTGGQREQPHRTPGLDTHLSAPH